MISYNKFDDIPGDKLHLPRVNNGVEIIVFETIEQHNAYLEALKVWSKENYCNELNEAHTQLFRNIYTERGYISYAEVESWANTQRVDERSLEWKAEAQSIIDWYQSTCISLYDYMDIVTEETAEPVEEFIAGLPSFTNG